MKTTGINFLLIIVLTIFTRHEINASIIHSASTGGQWGVSTTWVEGIVPVAGDIVFISSPSTVYIGHVVGYDIYPSYCDQITIENNAVLTAPDYGGGTGTFKLFVSGDLINNGTITNGEEVVKIILSGNLTNNGNYEPYETEFNGTDNQNLTLENNQTFGGGMIHAGSGYLTTTTDFIYTGLITTSTSSLIGDFNLNGATLHMGTHAIKSSGTLIYGGTIEGDFEILGTFSVSKYVEDTLIFQGNIIVTDTLQANEYGGGYGIFKLKVIGSITNNGWVKDNLDTDNPDDLNILITGNITNNGKWTNNFVNFIGTEPQYIDLAQGMKFVSYFTDLNPVSLIVANSDITNMLDINLNGATLLMEGYTLTLGGSLINGNIQNAKLHNGYLQNVTSLESIIIEGTVTCNSGNSFQNTVIVTDTLQSIDYGGGSIVFDLNIDGNITNNGLIRNINSGDMLKLLVAGNIINNGQWLHSYTTLTGTGTQSLTRGNNSFFAGEFYDQDAASNNLGLTDLTFTGNFNLGGALLDMEGHVLTMSGWLSNGNITNTSLTGGYLQNMVSLDNLTIEGKVTVDAGNHFANNVVVNDTLQSNDYGGGSIFFDLYIDGNLTNNGVIQNINSGDMLRLYISGDIQNNGKWQNSETRLNGSSTQILAQGDLSVFGGNFTDTDSQSNLVGNSNLTFLGDFNLNGGMLMMEGFEIRLQNMLYNGTLDNAKMEGGVIQNIAATTNLIIEGTVKMDQGNQLNCSVTVMDTLQSNTYGGGSMYYDLVIDGSITNYGVIKCWGSGILRLFITGNLTNAGEWVNYLTYLNGTEDQYVYLIGDSPIDGNVQFDAVLATTPFQWYHEGTTLDSPDFNGETSQVLSWNIPVQSSWYGTYYCETGEGNSRNIIVQKAMFPATNLQVSASCTDVILAWEMSLGGTPDSWNLYRNNELLSNVTTMSYTDKLLTPDENYAYFITAVYDGVESEPTASETISIPVPDNIIPENFSANTAGMDVTCAWLTPSGCLTPDGYNIYRDGIQLNTSLLTGLDYTDTPGYGSFEYYVKAVYYFGETEHSNVEMVQISGMEEWISTSVKIYPNPANKKFSVQCDEFSVGKCGIELYDLNGRKLLEKQIQPRNEIVEVNISGLEAGVYFCRILNEKSSTTQKIIIQK